LGELQEKLVRKFKFAPASSDAVRELLESIMIVVTPQKLDTPVCRDPDDDIILGTALAGEAVCIVTGDQDLLTIQVFRNIDLVAPSAFSDYEAAKTEPDASA
jgi:putative PIN family toxin of toxin-antitoxin system